LTGPKRTRSRLKGLKVRLISGGVSYGVRSDSQIHTEQLTNIIDLQMPTDGFTTKLDSQMHLFVNPSVCICESCICKSKKYILHAHLKSHMTFSCVSLDVHVICIF